MHDLTKFILTADEKFIVDRLAEIHEEKDKSIKKLNDCIPMLKAAFEVKKIWEAGGFNRACSIYYTNMYNWEGQGFDLKIMLGVDDKVKDTYAALRPLKYDSPVVFKRFTLDKENGVVGAEYKCKRSDRLLEVKIYVEKSRICNRVKVGEKTVDVYEMVCDENQGEHEQLDGGMMEKLLSEGEI